MARFVNCLLFWVHLSRNWGSAAPEYEAGPDDPVKYLKGDDPVTKEEAMKMLAEKAGLSESTIQFLDNYKYAESLFIKLASAMK